MSNWRSIRVAPKGEVGKIPSNAVLSALKAARVASGRFGARQHRDCAMKHYVCDRDKFVLSAIPKVGSKSFKALLLDDASFAGAVVLIDAPTAQVYASLEALESYFKFTFVRNSWDRVLSAYRDKVCGADRLGQLAILSRFRGLSAHMPFEKFVDWLASEEGSDACADRHWLSQVSLLQAGEGEGISCDFVGSFDNMAADFAKACRMAGISAKALPHNNKTVGDGGRGYRAMYNARTQAIVAERYATDIERFGFAF